MQFYVIHYPGSDQFGLPVIEFLDPEAYDAAELCNVSSFPVWVVDETAAEEWQYLYLQSQKRDSIANRSIEDCREDDRISQEERIRMSTLEEDYTIDQTRKILAAQKVLLLRIHLISDEALYPLALQEALKWIECSALPLNRNLKGLLRELHTESCNGPTHLDDVLLKNLSAVSKSDKYEFKAQVTVLLNNFRELVKFDSLLKELLSGNEFANALHTVALKAMQKDFVQHFIADLEYNWMLRNPRQNTYGSMRKPRHNLYIHTTGRN